MYSPALFLQSLYIHLTSPTPGRLTNPRSPDNSASWRVLHFLFLSKRQPTMGWYNVAASYLKHAARGSLIYSLVSSIRSVKAAFPRPGWMLGQLVPGEISSDKLGHERWMYPPVTAFLIKCEFAAHKTVMQGKVVTNRILPANPVLCELGMTLLNESVDLA